MTVQDMQRVLFQRSIWGNGFLWLRGCSKRGWVLDRILVRPV